jgi:hypothetical protein
MSISAFVFARRRMCGLAHEQVPGRQDLASVGRHRYGVLVLGGDPGERMLEHLLVAF